MRRVKVFRCRRTSGPHSRTGVRPSRIIDFCQRREAADELLGEAWLDDQGAAATAGAQLLGDLAFDPRMEAQHFELVAPGAQPVADDMGEALAHQLGKIEMVLAARPTSHSASAIRSMLRIETSSASRF